MNPTTDGAVRQTVALPAAGPWPCVDPFLFCVHHLDAYPQGDGALAPAAALHGRDIGQDFAGLDGWNMYHGSRVPGFPQHPHRGFETVTVVRRGFVDHADSLGATARYGPGDVQWLTAGGGISHSEMFPLLRDDAANPLELFQIWVNLPAADKMAPPHFSMLWSETVPVVRVTDDAGRAATVTVVAGRFGEHTPPAPPPASWAARPDSDVAIWTIALEPGAKIELPPAAPEETVRAVYCVSRAGISVEDTTVGGRHVAVVAADRAVRIAATGEEAVDLLVLQGRPIGEPVAQYGPFVMNDRAGIEQAFADYQRTRFGGWPWPSDDPVHPRDAGRFAQRPDGAVERPPA